MSWIYNKRNTGRRREGNISGEDSESLWKESYMNMVIIFNSFGSIAVWILLKYDWSNEWHICYIRHKQYS